MYVYQLLVVVLNCYWWRIICKRTN